MGSVKSQVLLFLDFFDRGKTRGRCIIQKIFFDETKILSGIWIGSRDGITGDRPEIANFELYKQFGKMVKYDRIFKLFMDFIQLQINDRSQGSHME